MALTSCPASLQALSTQPVLSQRNIQQQNTEQHPMIQPVPEGIFKGWAER